MTRIGLLSDTHGWLDDAVLGYFKDCDEIWHAGDIGSLDVLQTLNNFSFTRAVYGNIDGKEIRILCPENLRFRCEGVDVWITHIGGRPGNYSTRIKSDLFLNPPKLFVCGHSHICLVQMDKPRGFLHMNPGAAGRHGFHQVRTLIRFEIDGEKIQHLQVIELGKRA